MTGIVEINELIESGIHFGHRVRSWNPKMNDYIDCKRNGIHIIDLKETIRGLIRASRFIEMIVAEGKDVLFVGTKRQASALLQQVAENLKMPYVSERWLGGTLTNNDTLRKQLSRLEQLERTLADPTVSQNHNKKEMASLNREYSKIFRNLNGIRHMEGKPGLIVIVDINAEKNAVLEARKLNIPICALVDTDSDPSLVDVVVPGNDDALKAISLFLKVTSESVQKGLEMRKSLAVAQKAAEEKALEEKKSQEKSAAPASEDKQPSEVNANAAATPAPEASSTEGAEK